MRSKYDIFDGIKLTTNFYIEKYKIKQKKQQTFENLR